MSTTKTRIPLAAADRLAAKLIDELGPSCAVIEIAGSIRRRRPDVGDVELVAIPKLVSDGLFDGPGSPQRSLLQDRCDQLVAAGRMHRMQGGERNQRFMIGQGDRRAQLDLWICTPETWGVLFAIRTGSADFARSLVTPVSHGGRLQDGLVVKHGRVWRSDQVMQGMIDADNYRGPFFNPMPGAEPLPTPTERDFLALAGGWVEPCQRL
ncbi:hypothetical protein HED60_15060 [Planctomycetales bacterium ZRK34]|nr:hypothetical protein HED60_15060 [Planctomycetales bacterium ZRK34]